MIEDAKNRTLALAVLRCLEMAVAAFREYLGLPKKT